MQTGPQFLLNCSPEKKYVSAEFFFYHLFSRENLQKIYFGSPNADNENADRNFTKLLKFLKKMKFLLIELFLNSIMCLFVFLNNLYPKYLRIRNIIRDILNK